MPQVFPGSFVASARKSTDSKRDYLDAIESRVRFPLPHIQSLMRRHMITRHHKVTQELYKRSWVTARQILCHTLAFVFNSSNHDSSIQVSTSLSCSPLRQSRSDGCLWSDNAYKKNTKRTWNFHIRQGKTKKITFAVMVKMHYREDSQRNNLTGVAAEGGILHWAAYVIWLQVLEPATVAEVQCLSWQWAQPSLPPCLQSTSPSLSWCLPSLTLSQTDCFPAYFLSSFTEHCALFFSAFFLPETVSLPSLAHSQERGLRE